MAVKKQAKDALSKVSKQFWKDLKHNYRSISNFDLILKYILRLFEGQAVLMSSSQACYVGQSSHLKKE